MILSQDITVSKDSILVYNNPISSFADEVTFNWNSFIPVHLDSAFILIEEMDTSGFGVFIEWNHLELSWKEPSRTQQFIWSMENVGPDYYRLSKKVFYPTTAEPLSFSDNEESHQMFFLEIGYCFQCAVMPRYPDCIKGLLALYFSNGQVVELRLVSNDLRTSVINTTIFSSQNNSTTGGIRYLINGKRLNNSGKLNFHRQPVLLM